MRKWQVIALNTALIGFFVFIVTTPVWAVDLATPTAVVAAFTPAATPSPDAASQDDAMAPDVRSKRWTAAHQFEGGLQVGDQDDGATLLTWINRTQCSVNPGSITAMPTPSMIPVATKVTCGVTGAETSDLVYGSLNHKDGVLGYNGLWLNRCWVSAADIVTCRLMHSGGAALDPGLLVIDLLTVR